MQNQYTVIRRDPDGETRLADVRGTLFFHEGHWELRTADEVIHGTLTGHPHEAHVFVDEAGLEYRMP